MKNSGIETKRITIKADDGGTFEAYVAIPAKTDETNKKSALIVIQEIFGINEEMREKCDDFAKQGYVAICPDLFWRIEPGIELVDSDEAQLQRAFELYQAFDVDQGIKDLQAVARHAINMDITNRKVGAIGYCLGGHLSYRLAAVENLTAAVSYYGVAIEEHLKEMVQIKEPMLLHIAAEDEFVSKEAQDQILKAADKKTHVITHVYENQPHAFARGGGKHYNTAAAFLAGKRTSDFLKKYLAA
jgi:carboxymethylenebutenolidase